MTRLFFAQMSTATFKAPLSLRIWRQLKRPFFVAPLAFFAGGFWIQTYLGSVNSGKAHSQVFKAILLRLNELKEVKAMLGDQICFQETSRIKGDVNHIKGIADLSFQIHGENDRKANVYYIGTRYNNTDCWVSSKFIIQRIDQESPDLNL